MRYSGRIYKELCEAGMTENLYRKSIKNAVRYFSVTNLQRYIAQSRCD